MEQDQQPTSRQLSVGEAVARYSALRLLLFFVVFLPVLALLGDALIALGAGVLGSALLAIPLLGGPRRQLSAAVAARAQARQERQRQGRARLDES